MTLVVRENEPLSRHTAWRTGGACDAYAVLHHRESLAGDLAALRRRGRITLLGAGTRTVVRDGGLGGVVVRLGTDFCRVVRANDLVTVGAGVPLAALVACCDQWGLAGLASLAASPGSVGAAVALDPGPKGGWTRVVTEVSYVARGRVRRGTLEEGLAPGSPFLLDVTMSLAPVGRSSAGTSYRRGWESGASGTWFQRLARGSLRTQLVRSGLSGVRVRQVTLPPASPELLVNLGDATAWDLAVVERMVLDRVRRERGVELKPSVRWIGTHRESSTG